MLNHLRVHGFLFYYGELFFLRFHHAASYMASRKFPYLRVFFAQFFEFCIARFIDIIELPAFFPPPPPRTFLLTRGFKAAPHWLGFSSERSLDRLLDDTGLRGDSRLASFHRFDFKRVADGSPLLLFFILVNSPIWLLLDTKTRIMIFFNLPRGPLLPSVTPRIEPFPILFFWNIPCVLRRKFSPQIVLQTTQSFRGCHS